MDMLNNRRLSLESKSSKTIGYRHLQCLLMSIGIGLIYAMRINVSIAIGAMMDNKGANPNFPEYAWTEKTKSHVLSSFFCGYVLVQIPAGGWARRFGSRLLLSISVLFSSVLALLSPLSISIGGWALLFLVRFCQGLFQGLTLPIIATLLSKWAPIEERSAMQTYCYSGAQTGIVIMLATSGKLCSSRWSWPGTFYLPGLLGLVWTAIWHVFGANTPHECKHISAEERTMIETSLGQDHNTEFAKTYPVPWNQIFTSKHFLVLIFTHCVNNWCVWTLLTQIPSYMKSILNKDIESNALLSSLPYIAMLSLSLLLSPIACRLEKAKLVNMSVNRKIFNTIGQWIPVVTLVYLGYLKPDQSVLAIGLLTASVAINTLTHFGYAVNHLDLAPNLAGTLLGIVNCASYVMSILAPLVVGYIITDTSNISQWRTIFSLSGLMLFSGNLMYLLFGTAMVQPWNEPPQTVQEIETLKGLVEDAKKISGTEKGIAVDAQV